MLKTYWWKTPKGIIKNFGDQLNPYLFEKISGVKPEYCEPSSEYDTLLGIGSILGMLTEKLKYCIVWGSGFGRNPSKIKYFLKGKKLTTPKKILAVRGPLTRRAFLSHGIQCPEVYGDPALLLPKYYIPKIIKKYEIGIVPHYTDLNNKWIESNIKSNILLINVNDPVEKVIDDINSCKVIISSSLHGLIIADAYKIPSKWVIFSSFLQKQSFKFYDYFSSLGYYDIKSSFIRRINEPIEKYINQAQIRQINLDLDKLLKLCPFNRILENQSVL